MSNLLRRAVESATFAEMRLQAILFAAHVVQTGKVATVVHDGLAGRTWLDAPTDDVEGLGERPDVISAAAEYAASTKIPAANAVLVRVIDETSVWWEFRERVLN